jgi:transcriptional regulator with XRE-family HTH domain
VCRFDTFLEAKLFYDDSVSIIQERHMATKALSAKRANSYRLDLQRRRKDRGLSLETIAENTKISIRFLRAIEDEDFKQLPGGIFSTSYLRQYAAAVGLEERKLLECYERATEPASRELEVKESQNRGLLRWLGLAATADRG